MNVLVVYPVTPPSFIPVYYNHGLGYLVAYLKKHGHKVDLLCIHEFNKEKISNKIEKFNPKLITVSSVTNQIGLSKKIIKYIHEKYNLPIILGGVHAMVDPEDSISAEGVMGICLGEGEEALLELINKMEKGSDYLKVKNFWFKKEGKVIKNGLRPLNQNLDEYPYPDREIFFKNLGPTDEIDIMGTRGCPYSCTFCISKYQRTMYEGLGKFVRYRSIDSILDEIDSIKKKQHIRVVNFDDDCFILDRKRLFEFCDKYPKRFKIPFICNTRADLVDEEIIKALKKAGCKEIKIAIETGSDYIRNKVCKKNINKKQIINVFNLVRSYGIEATAFVMIGIPCETEADIKETIKLCRVVKPFRIGLAIFYPFQGTELYDLCKEKGWISNRKTNSFFSETTILDQPSISKEKISYYKKTFFMQVYHPYLFSIVRLFWINDRINMFNLILAFKRFLATKILSRKQIDFFLKHFKTF